MHYQQEHQQSYTLLWQSLSRSPLSVSDNSGILLIKVFTTKHVWLFYTHPDRAIGFVLKAFSRKNENIIV